MFNQVKLITSTKVSLLRLVTTGGVLSFCHIEGEKNWFLYNGIQKIILDFVARPVVAKNNLSMRTPFILLTGVPRVSHIFYGGT